MNTERRRRAAGVFNININKKRPVNVNVDIAVAVDTKATCSVKVHEITKAHGRCMLALGGGWWYLLARLMFKNEIVMVTVIKVIFIDPSDPSMTSTPFSKC